MAPQAISAPDTPPSSPPQPGRESTKKKIQGLKKEIEEGFSQGLDVQEKLQELTIILAKDNRSLEGTLASFSAMIATANQQRNDAISARINLETEIADLQRNATAEKGKVLKQVEELQQKNQGLTEELAAKGSLVANTNAREQDTITQANETIGKAKATLVMKEQEIAKLKKDLEDALKPKVVSSVASGTPYQGGMQVATLLGVALCGLLLIFVAVSPLTRNDSGNIQAVTDPHTVRPPASQPPSASAQGATAGVMPSKIDVNVTLPKATPTPDPTPPPREDVISYPQYVPPEPAARRVYPPPRVPAAKPAAPASQEQAPAVEPTIDVLAQQRQVQDANNALAAHTKEN